MAVGLSGQNQGNAGTTVVVTLTGTVTAGATLAAFHVRDNGSAFTSMTYSGGGGSGWNQINSELADATAGNATRGYYIENVNSALNPTVTLTKGSGAFATMLVLEMPGMVLSSTLDQNNRVLDTATPFDSPSVNTVFNNEVAVGFWAADDTGANAYAAGNGFAIQQQFSNGATNWTCSLATRVLTATGAYNTTGTRTGAARVHSWIATFREIATATASGPNPRTIWVMP